MCALFSYSHSHDPCLFKALSHKVRQCTAVRNEKKKNAPEKKKKYLLRRRDNQHSNTLEHTRTH